MDDALNLGFANAVTKLQARGALAGLDPDDCDFGSPEEAWAAAAEEALRRIRRGRLARLIAPSEGGRQLRDRFYTHLSIAEMAEDLGAWTRTFALPRGQLTAELAAGALQLWLSPAACDARRASLAAASIEPSACSMSRPKLFAFWIAPRESPAWAAYSRSLIPCMAGRKIATR